MGILKEKKIAVMFFLIRLVLSVLNTDRDAIRHWCRKRSAKVLNDKKNRDKTSICSFNLLKVLQKYCIGT